ncbi:hypothetical protein AAY80_115 [Stenotrophomonas phage vB_SmaS-DLP_6]|nr:hypothetical protein AAY80_115 [Stenotrophomonas phage vB_SmaS-DLP_6]
MGKQYSTREVSCGEIKPLVELAIKNIKIAREEEWEEAKEKYIARYAERQAKSWRVRFFGGKPKVKTDADADAFLRQDTDGMFCPSTWWWVQRKWETGEEMMDRLCDLCYVTKETDTIHITAEDAQVLRSWSSWKPKK